MSGDVPMTDEDRLIYQLTLHRDLVGWVIRKLAEAGNEIIDTATVIAVVSADKISAPGKAKFIKAGIAYAENIPLSEFLDV